MFDALKKVATKAGVWREGGEENSPTHASPVPVATTTSPQGVGAPTLSVVQPPTRPHYGGVGDPQMISSIKEAVLRASPTLTAFMSASEKMRKAFPNDEIARMKGALAMTDGLDKNLLLLEMQKTVASALQSAKESALSEHETERSRAVGSFEQQLEGVMNSISTTEAEITRLQSGVAEKRGQVIQLQNEVRTATADLAQRDSVVQASFAEVERTLNLMTQTFAQL